MGPAASGDLKRFWAAAAVLSHGLNPYDLELVSKYSIERGTGSIPGLPLYYPPLAFTLLVPLTFFSFELTRSLYFLGVVWAYAATWILPCLRVIDTKLQDPKTQIRFIKLLSLLSFFPILLMCWVGALTVFPFFGILFLLSRHNSGYSFSLRTLTGTIFSLTLIKPTTCLLVIPYVLCVWLRKREWQELIGFIIGIAVLTLPFYLLLPSAQTLNPRIEFAQTFLWRTPSPSRIFQELLGFGNTARVVPALIGVISAALLGFRDFQSAEFNRRISLLLLPLGFVLTPFAWTYDFVLLAFTLSCFFDSCQRLQVSRPTIALILALGFIVVNLLLSISPLAMELHWWYPIAILILTCIMLVEERSERHALTSLP